MLKGEIWMEIRKMYLDRCSISEIARIVRCCRTTARKYAKSDKPPKYKRKEMPSKLDFFKDQIKERLKQAPYTSVVLFEDIQKQGYNGGLTTVKNFVREVKEYYTKRAVMRFETLPGEQGQVDWSKFGTIEVDGKIMKLYCFDFVLGYSRTRYIEFTTSMDLETFIACHVNAFRYYGGAPKEILYDNLKQVVIKRLFKAKDSEMNEKFTEFAGYYGFKPILCRTYRPQTKGKVERIVGYVRGNFFIGIEYTDLNDLNNQAKAWLDKANNKIHGTTKEVPFERLKKENLTPVEGRPDFELAKIFPRKASTDCFVHFEGNQYSVPKEYAGKPVTVKIRQNKPLQVLCEGQVISEHKLSKEKGIQVIDKKHFEGIKELQYKIKKSYRQRRYSRQLDLKEIQVEVPRLNIYDNLLEVDKK